MRRRKRTARGYLGIEFRCLPERCYLFRRSTNSTDLRNAPHLFIRRVFQRLPSGTNTLLPSETGSAEVYARGIFTSRKSVLECNESITCPPVAARTISCATYRTRAPVVVRNKLAKGPASSRWLKTESGNQDVSSAGAFIAPRRVRRICFLYLPDRFSKRVRSHPPPERRAAR